MTRHPWIFFLLAGIFAISPPGGYAQTGPHSHAELYSLIRKIERQHLDWIGFKADLTIHFTTEENHVASCRGELVYQRLDEKIFLECRNEKKEVLFTFKTYDLDFALYLPGQKALFQGNIFDLENSEQIESHIKALDFYRALKPMSFTPDEARIEAVEGEKIVLKIIREKAGKSYLSRRLVTADSGAVFKETYYDFDGKPIVEIRRSDFESFQENHPAMKRKIEFPKRILIESQTRPIKTELIFHNLSLLWPFPKDVWVLRIPADTQVFHFQNMASAQARGDTV